MNDVLRIAHLRIAHQGAILRWAILTFTDDFGVKNYQKVSHNMILMSKYKGTVTWWKKGSKKFWVGVSPPLFGQCPKENIFFGRCSL